MRKALKILACLFYSILSIASIVIGVFLIKEYLPSDIYSHTYSFIGLILIMGGVCCFHIAKSIGGKLGIEYND